MFIWLGSNITWDKLKSGKKFWAFRDAEGQKDNTVDNGLRLQSYKHTKLRLGKSGYK